MLQLNNEKPNETYKFFRKYRSSNVKNLQLIKYKGIGYDNNNNADIISDNKFQKEIIIILVIVFGIVFQVHVWKM